MRRAPTAPTSRWVPRPSAAIASSSSATSASPSCVLAPTRLPALFHGIVFSALPGQVARTAVVIALSAGAAAAILGVVVFFDVLEHYDEPLAGGLIDTGRSNSV